LSTLIAVDDGTASVMAHDLRDEPEAVEPVRAREFWLSMMFDLPPRAEVQAVTLARRR